MNAEKDGGSVLAMSKAQWRHDTLRLESSIPFFGQSHRLRPSAFIGGSQFCSWWFSGRPSRPSPCVCAGPAMIISGFCGQGLQCSDRSMGAMDGVDSECAWGDRPEPDDRRRQSHTPGSGKRNRTEVPCAGTPSNQIWPPSNSVSRLAMKSPKPAPCCSNVLRSNCM